MCLINVFWLRQLGGHVGLLTLSANGSYVQSAKRDSDLGLVVAISDC